MGTENVRARLTYANVMSTIAVFGVLAGGGAYAASKIGSSDIAKNAVRSKHVKKKAIKGSDVKAESIKNALGVITAGPVALETNAPSRTLARSGPISLVLSCEGADEGYLRLRSSTNGFFNAVQYKSAPVLEDELRSLGGVFGPGDDEIVAGVAAGFDNDAGASFTARVGNATLSGEGHLTTTVNGCRGSFNGIAG